MSDSLKEIVYSKNVVEFVTVANEYCSFLERSSEFETNDFIDRGLKLLPLLYLKTQLLPVIELVNDEPNEKFVTEFDWQFIKNGVEALLGEKDTYLDYFDSEMNETPEPVTCSIAENLADIFQDLKDFLEIYKLGNEELSNDAIVEITESHRNYWGFRLVNSIRMLHHIQFIDDKQPSPAELDKKDSRNTEEWFISKAQNRFHSHE